MTTPLRRRLRRVRRLFVYGLATLVILLAVAVAIADRMLPVLARHPDDVAQWLSERIGRPVALDAVVAHWSRKGPLLGVTNLRIGQGDDVLEIGQAQLQINAYAGFLPGVPLTIVRVRGPDLVLDRNAAGEWRLEGLAARPGGSFDLRQLDGLGELQIEDAQLRFRDAGSAREWTLHRIDARLRTVGDRFRLGVVARFDDTPPLHLVADMDRELQDGSAWLGGEDLSLAPWFGGTPLGGVEIVEGRGDVGVWLTIAARRLESARLEATLSPLQFRGAEPIGLEPIDLESGAAAAADKRSVDPRYGLDRVAAALRWQRSGTGWTLDVAELDLDAGDARTHLQHVSVDGGASLRTSLRDVELGPLLSLAMLSSKPSPALRRWLYLATPRGHVSQFDIDWTDAKNYRVDAQLGNVGWQPAGRVPGVEGFAGALHADSGVMNIDVQAAPLVVDAPGVLRAPMSQSVRGAVNIYPGEPGWRIEAAGLAFRAEDYAFTIDGGIWLQGDGSKPFLDLRADVESTPVTAAKHFWIINKMPPKAVQWLDDALVSGQVASGRAVVYGDADDWPFRNKHGHFEALAELRDMSLRFRHDWPPGEAVSGTARFVDEGLEIDLSGAILGNRIERAHGGIADLRDPILELQVDGGGSGPSLLTLLRSSPLQQRYGNYLSGLAVGGSADIGLALHIPLKPTLGEFELDGRADLLRADLREEDWGLDFKEASGRVRFSQRGFSADELRVGFAKGTGALSVAVGGYTSDESRSAEASLRGRFAADALLQPYPGLHWLQPFLDGNSEWTMQLTVPRDSDGKTKQQLQVRSDLAGTALVLPAPLRKEADARLGLNLQLELPVSQGEIDLRLGELLRLRGRLPEGGAFTGVAAFGDAPDTQAPAAGLVAVGQVPVLDAAGWAAFALSSTGDGPGLQYADLYAGELDLLDRAFAETRITYARDAAGTLDIAFIGEPLQGKVQIPTADIAARGISADFERLHWPSQTPSGPSALTSADPAGIPALHLTIADFRFGEASLGKTKLETYPTPEGLHVEHFDTTSKALELRASGDWMRIDGGERSNFHIDFAAQDLGAMLRALGFSELIAGGSTTAQLQATWPGAPAAFELEKVHGTLTAQVGKGRVLEVEPGAGRLFGLLSLTEIPRRLALDFSDFFKSGLAFNRIDGSFTLDGGNAFTDDLRIDGPAAEIRVRGRTGLKQKDYDQTMEVLPRAGSVLPALGALAAGPAGAALGAVAQAMFQQPIKQMARTVYRVQGSWDKPQIDVIDRGPAGGSGAGHGARSRDARR